MNAKDIDRLLAKFPEQADKILGNEKREPTPLDKERAKQLRESLERTFLATWRILMVPWDGSPSLSEPEQQYQFDEVRKWRFDFAWPAEKLAVEIHGGQWAQGRHNRGMGMQSDMEKKRAAIAAGWHVLEYGTDDMRDPCRVITQVAAILKKLKGEL